MAKATDLLQGTLDLLILKTLALEPMHGWGIVLRIQQISGDVLQVQPGSLYPALHRLEHQGWIGAKWADTEAGRRAKVLLAHPRRPEAARERDRAVAPAVRRGHVAPRRGVDDGARPSARRTGGAVVRSATDGRAGAGRRAPVPFRTDGARGSSVRRLTGAGPAAGAAPVRRDESGQGGLPGHAHTPPARTPAPGHPVRRPPPVKKSCVHAGGGTVAGPGDRRQQRHLLGDQRGCPALAAGREAGRTGRPAVVARRLGQPALLVSAGAGSRGQPARPRRGLRAEQRDRHESVVAVRRRGGGFGTGPAVLVGLLRHAAPARADRAAARRAGQRGGPAGRGHQRQLLAPALQPESRGARQRSDRQRHSADDRRGDHAAVLRRGARVPSA